MKTNRFFIIVILVTFVFLGACTTSVKQQSLIQDSGVKLTKGQVAYVIPVEDGSYNGKVYVGSGKSVTHMFETNLGQYLQIASTVRQDVYYTIKPIILHWEPRAAAWSGRATKVQIRVLVYAANEEKEIISRDLDVKGRSMSFTNQSAEELANFLIKQFCQEIF